MLKNSKTLTVFVEDMTDEKIKSVGKELKGKLPYFVIYVPTIIYFVVYFYFQSVPDAPFPDYQFYQTPIITGISVTFGLVAVVTLYYLGKYHDIIKEYAKIRGELQFIVYRIKDYEKDAKELFKEQIKEYSDIDKIYDEQRDTGFRLTRTLILSALGISAYFVLVILSYVSLIDEPEYGNFITNSVGLIAGIVIFVLFWLQFEDLTRSFISLFESHVLFLATTKYFLYKLDKATGK